MQADAFSDQFSEFTSAMYDPAKRFGNAIGRPLDQSIYILATCAALVSGLILVNIRNVAARKVFSFVMGVSIQISLVGTGFLLNIPLSMVCYLSMTCLHRNVQHIVTIIITFSAMTLLHMYYEALDINIMNMSTVSMISFCK